MPQALIHRLITDEKPMNQTVVLNDLPTDTPEALQPESASDIPRRNLPLMLLQVRELVMSRFRPMLNEAGVTEPQWRVLRALLGEGALEPRQIVEICCLSSASLVGILVRMEDLGLIIRKKVEGDQRRVRVTPSAKGRRLAAKLAPQIQVLYAQLESDLGAEVLGSLITTLDAVQAKLGGSTAEPTE